MYHPSYDYDLKLIKIFSKKKEALDIVDYGCGNGILLDFLPKKMVKSYKGFEVSDAALKVGKAKYSKRRAAFAKIDAPIVPSLGRKNSIDLIILVGVFQYLSAPEVPDLLKEAQRVLRPGGILVASCVVDHWWYRATNLYRFILPNSYMNRKKLLAAAQRHKLKVVFAQERGLFIGPLFSHGVVIFFDALDKLVFRNQGKLGPIGIFARKLAKPLMSLEYKLPIDYGYTLFVVFQK
jgi:SAM-dependent methyltransferase